MKTLLLSLLTFFALAVAQAQVLPSDTVPAKINYDDDTGKFSAELRALRPIAGAPAPFYTYFWEFGDGGFSFEKDPLHIYSSSNPVKVRLFATNNYDDGKHPPTRPRPIKPTKPASGGKPMLAANTPNFFKTGGSIELKSNAMPKPGDDMMLVFGYRNKASNGQPSLNGTLAILYNDKEFSNNNFVLTEGRTYFGEKKAALKPMMEMAYLPQHSKNPVYYASANPELNLPKEDQVLLKDKAKDFKNQEGWRFENLQRNRIDGDHLFGFVVVLLVDPIAPVVNCRIF